MAETKKDEPKVDKSAKPEPAPAPPPAPKDEPKTPDGVRERGSAMPAGPLIPTGKEVEAIRKAHFGDKPGAVQIDTDTDPATLVFVDRTGKAVGRQPFTRKGAK
jgi:hypothetical protein